MNRTTFEKYFMEITKLVATRSTCTRRQVGAIAVRDNQILSTGYNGSPTGLEHCDVTGCIRQELKVESGKRHELCRAVHAEQNVIIQALNNEISLKGATIFVTNFPCIICTKMLINTKIKEIIYLEDYNDRNSKQFLNEAGIEYRRFEDE